MSRRSGDSFSPDPGTARLTGRGTPGRVTVACLAAVTLAGCAVSGTPYPEVMAHAAPVDEGVTRVMFLRPADRFDNYSASAAVIRIDGEKVARLGFGGFFYVDLPAGSVAIKASARGAWLGACEVQLHAAGGDTVYLDVGPRTRHAMAGLLGAVAGANAVNAALPAPAIDRVLVDAAVVGVAASVAGDIASSVESAGRKCGGPYQIKALSGDEARPHLQTLAWSK